MQVLTTYGGVSVAARRRRHICAQVPASSVARWAQREGWRCSLYLKLSGRVSCPVAVGVATWDRTDGDRFRW